MVNRRIRALLFFFIVSGMIGLFLAVSWMEGQQDEQRAVHDREVAKRLERINFYGVEGAKKVWELFADRGVQKKDDVVLLDNIRLIYHLNGKSHTLTGKKASYNTNEEELEVEGDVKVVSTEGYTLLTDFLIYSLSKKKVTTDRPIRFYSDNMDVEGVGFEADLSTSLIRVLKDVRAVLKDVSI